MQPRSLHRSTASLHVGLRDLDRKKQRYNDQSVTRCRKSQFAHGQFARKVENLLESHKLQLPAETKKHMYALLLQKVVLLLDLGPEDIRTFPLGFVVIVSYRKAISQCHNSFFRPKIDDHGLHQGNTGRIIARWQRTVASKVALDMLHWVMRSSTHRRIIMAVIMAHDGGTFVRCCRLFCLTNCSKIT